MSKTSKYNSSKKHIKKYESSEDTTDIESSSDNSVVTKKKYVKKDETSESESISSDDSNESSETAEDSEKEKINRAKKNLELYEDNDIRNIIIKDIDNDFAEGNLGPLKVIIMKKNGYMNASKLCKDAKKEYKDWARNKDSKGLLATAKKVRREFSCDLTIRVHKGLFETRGTYVPSKIITHIASWCNHEYALMVSDIVDEYHIKKAKQDMQKMIGEKDDKITNLENIIKQMRKENKNALNNIKNQNNKLQEQNNSLDKKAKNILKDTKQIINQNVVLDKKLDGACNKRVVNEVPSSDNMLVIFKNNDVPKKKSDILYEYTAKRVMKKNYSQTKKDHKREHPDMEVFVKYDFTPNSKILWLNIKKKLKSKIECRSGNFNLKKKYTAKQLKKDIEKIHNERFDRDNIDSN